MAKDETQMQPEVIEPKEPKELKEPLMASVPEYGACTRWLERIRRKRLLRWIVLSKIGNNNQGRRPAQEPQASGKRYHWYWVLLICIGLGMCLERYANYRSPSEEEKYCERSHRLGDMVAHVRRQVLHQDEALDQLEWALKNDTFRNIALVGSSGVGKSHTARSLREHFPWPENVKTLSWRETPSLLRVQSMLKNILLCGQNLILIDDLTPLDGHLVPIINELIRGRMEIAQTQSSSSTKSKSNPNLKELTSIFMFTVDRQQPEEIFQAELKALQQLPETHVITFAALEPSHLVDCQNLGSFEDLQQDIDKSKGEDVM
ncbi:hypothetical protein KR054_002478 [Drosophila jambulina]|nr:hypothetical protein KR054_002478 [Drosophila jambulina]